MIEFWLDKMKKEKKIFSWLWSKGNTPSKSAFWQFMTTIPVTAFLWLVVYRMARLPDELFLQGLIGASGFFAIVEAITLYWYHIRKVDNPGLYNKPNMNGVDDPKGNDSA